MFFWEHWVLLFMWMFPTGHCVLPHNKTPFRNRFRNMTRSPMLWFGLETPQIPIQLTINEMRQNHETQLRSHPTRSWGAAINVLVPGSTGPPQRSKVDVLTGQSSFGSMRGTNNLLLGGFYCCRYLVYCFIIQLFGCLHSGQGFSIVCEDTILYNL